MVTATTKPVTVQQILQQYHTASSHLHVDHVMTQIKKCKTNDLGFHLYKCKDTDCAQYTYQYHSCRNRHCTQCGGFKKDEWVEDRRRELLPIGYYHVVFTLPHELNSLILGNRTLLLKLLFDCSAQTLLTFGKDERHLGAQPGIISVLHTWGQDLSFHPHVHCIVSGGGIVTASGTGATGSTDRLTWRHAKRIQDNFLFPVNAMRVVFRAKYLEGIKSLLANGLLRTKDGSQVQRLINCLFRKNWNLYAKAPCAGPEQVIEYLGRYTHKVAISNYRIMENDTLHGTVTFRYKDYADGNATKLMTITGKEFVRRFEQHILPKQFTKIRSYGYLSNRGRTQRMGRITEAMQIPAHPPKVKTPWTIRLFEKIGNSGSTCPHCKKESLELVWVQLNLSYQVGGRRADAIDMPLQQQALMPGYNDS
jgi:predicted Zn-ribbon and HTH transcriptional regulator